MNRNGRAYTARNEISLPSLIPTFCSATLLSILVTFGQAQVRGVYPPGMSSINSGVTPEPGFSYSNAFLFYSRNQMKGANGEVLATGLNSVLMDMNSFIWTSKKIRMLGNPAYSFVATLPIANNSLTSDAQGSISGGGGFADSYYQPFILGWETRRLNFRTIYGFLAPTGRFDPNSNSNVGSGYWTHCLSTGETFYLSENNSASISAFALYEFHTVQQGTGIHPGQTLNLDYSLTQTFFSKRNLRLQAGLVGYEQWQTTAKRGPTVSPDQMKARYQVNALGFAATAMLLQQKTTLGTKYFREFSNRSTLQGYSLQISVAVAF